MTFELGIGILDSGTEGPDRQMLLVKNRDRNFGRIRRIAQPVVYHHTGWRVLPNIRDRPVPESPPAAATKPPRIIHRKDMEMWPQRIRVELLHQAKIIQHPECP